MSKTGDIHRQMLRNVEAARFDSLREQLHADYIYMGADGVEHKGADHAISVAETYTTAFPDMQLRIRDQFEPAPGVSIVEFTATGTHQGPLEDLAPTGRRVELPVCNIIEVVDGRIHREREYFDTYAMLAQLGALEA